VNCPLPEDVDAAVLSGERAKEMGCKLPPWIIISSHILIVCFQDQIWMINFTKLVTRINATAFGARPPSFQVLLYLDRVVRTYPIPKHLWEITQNGGMSAEVMKAWSVLEAKDLSESHVVNHDVAAKPRSKLYLIFIERTSFKHFMTPLTTHCITNTALQWSHVTDQLVVSRLV
jgi:hypothetical protein